jgi:diphthine-ammonia ligase
MKIGVLFSGGKDSCLALQKSISFHEVACLVTLVSESDESYMFHVPNIELSQKQAEAIGLPLVQRRTKGEKEKELLDLKNALCTAKADYGVEGIVTGTVKSVYQSTRVQKICRQLGLWCFNPLWLQDEIELLRDVASSGLKAVITGVFAYPLDKEYLGRILDDTMIRRLEKLRDLYGISPAGEGGEMETTVTDAPFFKKKLEILSHEVDYKAYSGVFRIRDARLRPK